MKKRAEHHLVHFGRAVDEPRLARVAVDPLERRVLRVAARAVQLDRGVDGLVQHVGDRDFRHRDFLAREVAAVELVRRAHDEQPPDLDLHRGVAEQPLHALAVGELACRGSRARAT